MKILDFLSSKITTPSQTIQFAKDGKYEEAWILSLNDKRPSIEDIDKYLKKEKFENLIVEFIWNPNENSKRFVLTIFQEKCKVKKGQDFINICFNIFYSQASFNSLIDRINNEIIGSKCLFNSPVELVRLGVFNNWFSVGPIDLWHQGDTLDKEDVFTKINKRPEVKKSNLNYQGLAFIFNFSKKSKETFHGLKTPCCTKNDGIWEVNLNKVYSYMKKMIN